MHVEGGRELPTLVRSTVGVEAAVEIDDIDRRRAVAPCLLPHAFRRGC